MTVSPFCGWTRKKPAKPWGWNGSTARNLSILAFFALFVIVTGCLPILPEEQYDDSCLRALGSGRTVDVSALNAASHTYTIVTVQPANKPESNDAPSTYYQYNLTATTINPSLITPSFPHRSPDAGKAPYTGLPAYQGQAQVDRLMRKVENAALGRKIPQVSRQTAARAPFVPMIDIGTIWNNVMIAITGNSISTTCRYVSEHAYFFVDNRNIAAIEPYLASYGAAFDAIYDVNRSKFGEENDVDGYKKIFVIFSEELELIDGLLGYFYAGDKFSKDHFPDSNEGDIFYITTDADYQGDIINGTLAHEFQHMIYFDQHFKRGVQFTYSWLNEALSQAAEYYNGYTETHEDWIEFFLNSGWYIPEYELSLSLTHWTSANYGYGAVFIRYLIDRYGDAAIKNMCSTSLIGVAAVQSATKTDFNTLFTDFTRALVVSGTGDTANPRYNFKTLDLHAVQPGGPGVRSGLTTPFSPVNDMAEGRIPPYGIAFTEWSGDYSAMTLTGNSAVGTVFGLSQ